MKCAFLVLISIVLICLRHANSQKGDSEVEVISNHRSKCSVRILQAIGTTGAFCVTLEHYCNEKAFLKYASTYESIGNQNGCMRLIPSKQNIAFPRKQRTIYRPLSELATIDHLVTVLRHPTDRKIVSFCNHHNLVGYLKDYEDIKFDCTSKKECIQNYISYANSPRTIGCYIKVLNSLSCTYNIEITAIMVENALYMIKEFLFVGILEEYEASVKLFHRLHNDTLFAPPHPIEFSIINDENQHTNNSNCYQYLHHADIIVNDNYDVMLYQNALHSFHQKLIAFNLS